ncbi:MAG TPA: ribbon-helix-helix protein, CopG family [Thermoanaerobaculia bacterium]|jgi:predicted transcriptional regulator
MPRLTIEFPEEGDRILSKLAKDEDTTKREVIRRALALYNYIHKEGVRMGGGERRLSITDKDSKVVKDIII